MEITVIIPDGFIQIEGEGLMGFDLSEYSDIKAIQSIDGKTHILKINGDGDFDDNFDTKPFVDLFNQKKSDDAKALDDYLNSPETIKQTRIAELQKSLSETDFKFTDDYDAKETNDWRSLKAERQAWRDELRLLMA